MNHPFVLGEHVYLRALEPEDLERCLAWISDPEVTQYLLAGRFPLNHLREQEWISGQYKDQQTVVFGVCKREDDDLIGSCGLHDIHWVDRTATLGIMIGNKTLWGKGHGTQAMRLLISYAFSVLNLHRVQLEVFDFNVRAQKSYEKLGFVKEGVLRKRRFKLGHYCDEIVMGLLSEEWTGQSVTKRT